MFLGLYYAVLVERNPREITAVEVLLYVWIAAFAYAEFGEFKDAGTRFYAADFWSLWDIGIIGVGVAYLVSSKYLEHLNLVQNPTSYPWDFCFPNLSGLCRVK